MSLSGDMFKAISDEVVDFLGNNKDVSGIKAEWNGREFSIFYFRQGGVWEKVFRVSPPNIKKREEWFSDVLPEMNHLSNLLDDYTKELNEEFLKEYVSLLRKNSLVAV